jgi:broad specificity phosphatase PhoE
LIRLPDLFLVRHGQTEWNLIPRIQGNSDSPLTRLGVLQAQAAGRLLRTVLAGRLEPLLREVSWGEWDGLSRDEIELAHPGGWMRVQRDWSFAPVGGERYTAAAERLANWLRSLRRDRPVIAVTHGMASCILRGLALGIRGDDVLALERPQDALFRLKDGRVERLVYPAG